MSEFIQTEVRNRIAHIILDRPKALNSLSLDMIRTITEALLAWREDDKVQAVVIRSTSERALCAGGDIRFFYDNGTKTPQGGSALLEDFFTEEYALNHLIHFYPKPYIALMDGIVMGGGMGVAQGGEDNRMRIVTERTKMAMPTATGAARPATPKKVRRQPNKVPTKVPIGAPSTVAKLSAVIIAASAPPR